MTADTVSWPAADLPLRFSKELIFTLQMNKGSAGNMDFNAYFREMNQLWLFTAYIMALSVCFWFLIQPERKKK